MYMDEKKGWENDHPESIQLYVLLSFTDEVRSGQIFLFLGKKKGFNF